MKTLSEIALETMEQQSKQKLPNFRVLVEPKHWRLEREMLERSRPVNSTREKELLAVLWSQVAGK